MPALGGFSRYELQERIGIGGMAEVFRARAWDGSGNARDVVVKKILPHHDEEADFRSMFMDEARIAANLDHPNVVRVLDLGRLDGDLFLAMEYVEGSDLLRLATWLDGAGRRMGIGTAIHIVMQVLDALQHAHTRVDANGRPLGIVHRDVTPQNVLVGLDASVRLTDFGIARAANRLSHTMAGVVKGNLLYVAPEQIAGQPVEPRADVYSAGILLHRLLSGRHPFEGDPLPKVYQRSLSGDIPPPSRLNPQVPTNLDLLVQRATSLAPAARFQTAEEFRAALNEFLVGKQLDVDLEGLKADVRALRMGLRASPRDGRVLVAGVGASGSELRSVATNPAPASPLFTPDDDPSISAKTKPIVHPDDGFAEDAPTTLQQIPRSGSSGFDLSAGTDTSTKETVPALPGLSTFKALVEPAPPAGALKAGSTLLAPKATTTPVPVVVEDEADTDEYTEHESTKPSAIPAAYAEQIGLASPQTPDAILEGHEQPVVTLAAVREGRFVVSGSHDASVRVWDLTHRACVHVLAGHTGPVTSVALATDGARVVSGSADQTVRVWDPETGKSTATMKGHTDWVLAVAVAPDGRTALSGGADKNMRVWDLSTGKELLVLEPQASPITALSYLGDGTLAVSATLDGVVSLWNVLDGMPLTAFPTGISSLRALALSRDGRRAVLGGADGQVRVWDMEKGALAATLPGHKAAVTSLALTADFSRALSGSADGTARLFDLASATVARTFGGHGPVASVAFAIDGHAALVAAQKRVLLWDL